MLHSEISAAIGSDKDKHHLQCMNPRAGNRIVNITLRLKLACAVEATRPCGMTLIRMQIVDR
jgi:hypothetical protein